MRSILLSVLSRPVANILLASECIVGSKEPTFLPKESLARPLPDHLGEWQIANSQSNLQAVNNCVKSCTPVIFAKVACSGTEGRAVFGQLGMPGFARKPIG